MPRPFLVLVLAVAPLAAFAQSPWVLATQEPRATAGESFMIEVIGFAGEVPPEALALRLRGDRAGRVIAIDAVTSADGSRRTYRGRMPEAVSGAVTLELLDRPSSALVLVVQAAPDNVQRLITKPAPVAPPPEGAAHAEPAPEPPLAANEPVYFLVGSRAGTTARFQLSFRYRLFDDGYGLAENRSWLSGFWFAYTQTSLWDLSAESAPFRDTSYRPSLFWQWERRDDKTWVHALRMGYEHESNGRDGMRSRSIDTLFVRPEWRMAIDAMRRVEFTPKFYGYLDKADNPDIQRYRGYVDWRVRYAYGNQHYLTALARTGTAGRGSLLVDAAWRTRALDFGPVSGYLHLQYFTGYGEDILSYNLRRKSQIRIGFSIVP